MTISTITFKKQFHEDIEVLMMIGILLINKVNN